MNIDIYGLIENGNIDVFVDVEEGYTYTVILATAKNLEYLMDNDFYNEKRNYFGPGYLFIIVKELTQKIIEETLQAYAKYNDGYWLKLSHFEGDIDETVFNQLEAEHILDIDELYIRKTFYLNF
jgi:hypothetical protein